MPYILFASSVVLLVLKAQMPDSNPDVEALCKTAVAIESESERAAFLQKSCGDDNQLRSQVERLLKDKFNPMLAANYHMDQERGPRPKWAVSLAPPPICHQNRWKESCFRKLGQNDQNLGC